MKLQIGHVNKVVFRNHILWHATCILSLVENTVFRTSMNWVGKIMNSANRTDPSNVREFQLGGVGARQAVQDRETDSHAVATAVGTAAGAAAAGVALGVVAGPIGMVVGSLFGGLAGGAAGNAFGEEFAPEIEDREDFEFDEDYYQSSPYFDPSIGFEVMNAAFQFGAEHYDHGLSFQSMERILRDSWNLTSMSSCAPWEKALPAVRDAWNRQSVGHDTLDCFEE